jgi:DNA-binding NarL/FixJ family response regulator
MIPVRVLVVDDHPIFRMGLVAAIEHMQGIDLVGEVDTAEAVDAAVEAQRPDVVLLDLSLPDGSGLDVNRRLASTHPDVKVIVLTMSEDHQNLLTALHDGARGYFVKGAGPERVEHAIRTVATGAIVLEPDLVPTIADLARARTPTRSGAFADLTTREFEVLELIAEGLDNTSIARRLALSPKTVRNHVSLVMTKIHARDRSAAIVIARQRGLGGDGDHATGRPGDD